MSIKIAVLDEDPLARERILRFLRTEEDVAVVGVWTWSGEASRNLRRLDADIVFLNVPANPSAARKVVEAIDPARTPVVVFVTTYDPSLVHAFERHGVDYLLKPFDAARFGSALRRARERLRETTGPTARAHLYRLLWNDPARPRPRSYTRWFALSSTYQYP